MFQGKVILVVDDEADLREILRDELVYEGATVYEAANGTEALVQLSKMAFDAVLSDIRMPGGDGTTLARKIREKHSTLPVVILITGFADLHVDEAYDLGADGYVTKPFHLDALKSTLQRLLQAPEARWAQETMAIPQKLRVPMSLGAALQEGLVHLGRGGFFLQVDPNQMRMGDLVEVQFEKASPIQAQVRWARGDRKENHPPGLGLEFLSMSKDVFSELQKAFPQWQQQKSFIPQN